MDALTQSLMMASPILAWITSDDGVKLFVNPAFESFFGKKEGSLAGRSLEEVFPPEFAAEYRKNNLVVLESGKSIERIEMAPRKDGSIGYFLVHKFPLVRKFENGHWKGMVAGHAIDVTDLKLKEFELAKLSERLSAAVDATGIGIFDVDVTTNEMFWSLAMYEHYGVDPLTFTPNFSTIAPLIHEEDRSLLDWESTSYTPENPCYVREFRIVQASGRVRNIRAQGRALFRPDGSLYRFIGTQSDITEELKIRKRFKNLAMIVDHTKTGVVICDRKGEVEWLNAAFEKISGYTLAEVKGKKPKDFLCGPETDLLAQEEISRAMREKRSFRLEILNYRKSGEKFWNEIEVQPVFNSEGELTNYISLENDITEKKLMQEQSFHSERLATLGLLASGIAHEINNPLAVVQGLMDLYRERQPSREEFHLLQDKISRACERIQGIVKGLRAYSRTDSGTPMALDLSKVVEETLSFLSPLIRKSPVRVVLHLDKKLPPIIGESGRLQQVITNLITNAQDAFQNFDRANPEISLTTYCTSSEVVLSIKDNGSGIPKEIMNKIFDPFFTSKSVGKGTGLGLAICYGIVSSMRGQIKVSSELGQGSEFRLHFPIADAVWVEPEKKVTMSMQKNSLAGRTILLLDDEIDILEMLAEILEGQGAKVFAYHDFDTAVSALHTEQFDHCIVDYHMPKGTGMDFIRIAREKVKKMPAFVLISGAFTDPAREEDYSQDARSTQVKVLEKPFGVQKLLETLQ